MGRWKAIWTMPKKTGHCLWGPYLKLFGALKWVRVAKNLFVLRPCRHHILSQPTSIDPHFQWHNLQGLQTRTNIKKEMKTDFKFPRTTPTSCLSDWSVCNWPSRTSFLELMSSPPSLSWKMVIHYIQVLSRVYLNKPVSSDSQEKWIRKTNSEHYVIHT